MKQPNDYYYNADAIRSTPRQAKVVNGAIVSATNVSGVRYKRQIELSTTLTDGEKVVAFKALNTTLERIGRGEITDFRMIIRGQQRTTHSDSKQISGRARELQEKGFYFLFYHPKGSKPGDHVYKLKQDEANCSFHLGLDTRFSTDANGIAECLGLQTNQRMEFEQIVKLLGTKISQKTLFTL